MVNGRRVGRLAARVAMLAPDERAGGPTEIWLPDNGRSDAGPGRYRMPGGTAVLVIYDPDVESPPRDGE